MFKLMRELKPNTVVELGTCIGISGMYCAAGLTMKIGNIDEFKERFEDIVSETIDERSLIQEIEIDSALKFEEITPSFLRSKTN